MDTKAATSLLSKLNNYNEHELRRLLVDQLTRQRVGLYWESDAIARDAALNMDVVLPRLVEKDSFSPSSAQNFGNLIIEGDNFDALRLLRTTHAEKIRVRFCRDKSCLTIPT
jgi:adenine-specific DNA-methyltransferase